MLTATEQCFRGLLVAGFVAAFAGQVYAGEECCAKKKVAASACAGHSVSAETAKPITHTLALKGLTDANAGSIKEALAEFASTVELNSEAGTADITWKPGQAVQVSRIQKALESARASIDEDRWTFAGPVRLQVAGMSCGGCSSAIKAALGKIEGLGEVAVDFRSSEEGFVSFAGAGVAYGAVQKALTGTPYRLVDASFCGNCSGGAGPCCGLCPGKSTGATASSAPTANPAAGCRGGCGGGEGCNCPGCVAKAKTLTKTEE